MTTIPQTHNRFETLAWRYTRLSGVLIIPLAFGHLAIVHLINSVAVIDYQWVVETRWAFLGWRLYDAFFLWFAGLHGFNGLRMVIGDYVHQPGLKRALTVGAALLLIALLALGSIALIGTPVPEALARLQ
jgi:succinate dehydrogenase / fumarate reductase membrane anchor subunit